MLQLISLCQLQRGFSLANVGWVVNTVYPFRFEFTPENVKVYRKVNNVFQLELDVAPRSGTSNFKDGRFAFYNYSQSGVRYIAFATDSFIEYVTTRSPNS